VTVSPLVLKNKTGFRLIWSIIFFVIGFDSTGLLVGDGDDSDGDGEEGTTDGDGGEEGAMDD
jgi:hypothetical protein